VLVPTSLFPSKRIVARSDTAPSGKNTRCRRDGP
jgi:hypothetical protein